MQSVNVRVFVCIPDIEFHLVHWLDDTFWDVSAHICCMRAIWSHDVQNTTIGAQRVSFYGVGLHAMAILILLDMFGRQAHRLVDNSCTFSGGLISKVGPAFAQQAVVAWDSWQEPSVFYHSREIN